MLAVCRFAKYEDPKSAVIMAGLVLVLIGASWSVWIGTLDVSGQNPIVVDHKMCLEVNSGGQCIGPTNSFTLSDASAVSWVRFEQVLGSHIAGWDWIAPTGDIVRKENVTFCRRGTQCEAWSLLSITSAARFLGNWTVKVSVDGKYVFDESFTLQKSAAALDTRIAWVRTWGGSKYDWVFDTSLSPDGSLYAAGERQGDALILKYSNDGDLLWAKTWGGEYSDYATGVKADESGIYVTGLTWLAPAPSYDAFVIKLSPDGELIWGTAWRLLSGNYATDIGLSDDGVYVVGSSNNVGFLVKFSNQGEPIWERIWQGSETSFPQSVAVSPNGDVNVLGFDSTVVSQSVYVLRFTSSGELLWQRTWSGGKEDYPWNLAVSLDDSIYATGWTDSFGNGEQVFLLKFSSDGSLLWQKSWGGRGRDNAFSVGVGRDNAIYLTGETFSFSDNPSCFILRYSSDGELVSQSVWGLNSSAFGRGIAISDNGSIYVTGFVESPPPYQFGTIQGISTPVTGSLQNLPLQKLWSAVGSVRIPMGRSLTTINGSTQFAGGRQVFVVKLITIHVVDISLNQVGVPVLIDGQRYENESIRLSWLHGSKHNVTIGKGFVDTGPGERLRFSGWTGSLVSDSSTLIIIADSPVAISANWKTQYYVSVESEYGRVEGTGWYDKGTLATISVSPTSTPGAWSLLQHVFTRWEGENVDSPDSSKAHFIVERPSTIRAQWTTDYTGVTLVVVLSVLGIVAALSIVLAKRRRVR